MTNNSNQEALKKFLLAIKNKSVGDILPGQDLSAEDAENNYLVPVPKLPDTLLNDPTGQIQPIAPDAIPATYPAARTISDIPVPVSESALPPQPDWRQNLGAPEIPANAPMPAEIPVPNLPVPINRARTSADAQNDINTISQKDYSGEVRDKDGNIIKERGKDRSRNWTMAQKFLSTLAGAGQGLLQGGIGGALVGGLMGGTNRNYFAQQRDNRNLARYIPEQKQLQEREQFETKQAEAQRKAEMDKLDAQGKTLDILRTANKPLYDAITADQQITPEEAERLKVAGYPVVPFDARRFDTDEIEGTRYETPQLGKPTWQESDRPTERVKVPVGVKVKNPDGTEMEVPMLPQDAANFGYRSTADKAKAEAEAAEIERREREIQEKREEKTFGTVQEWQAARTKAGQVIPTYERSVQQINSSISEIDQQIQTYQGSYDTSELLRTKQGLEKQRTDAEVKLAEARAVYQTPKPKVFTPSTSKGKNPKRNRSYTDSDIDRIIRQ